MAELLSVCSTPWNKGAAVRLAQLAERQPGLVTAHQLGEFGLSRATIARWSQGGGLHRIYRGVYAVGHRALSLEARLAAALLYAGPSAMLSHVTAAWWWELWGSKPRHIHVSASGRRPSLLEVRVHHPRTLEGTIHKGLLVTTIPRTLLDLASAVSLEELRKAVAEAEYRGLVRLDALDDYAGRGRPGSALQRVALARHRLARTLSVLEEKFLALCEANQIPLPQVNAKVCGLMVDAWWPEQNLIVELDGHAAHATPAAIERDRPRELRLRTAGQTVLRYTWQQITEQPAIVVADLLASLAASMPEPATSRVYGLGE
jgi:very-short-patch-repair endonuclease